MFSFHCIHVKKIKHDLPVTILIHLFHFKTVFMLFELIFEENKYQSENVLKHFSFLAFIMITYYTVIFAIINNFFQKCHYYRYLIYRNHFL